MNSAASAIFSILFGLSLSIPALPEPGFNCNEYFRVDCIKYNSDDTLSVPEVIINEILYRRKSSGEPEFVELLNLESEPVDLSNWTLSDAESEAVIPAGTTIPPGGYLVFTDRAAFTSPANHIIYLPRWPGYSNAGDHVMVRTASGLVTDSLHYSPDWGSHVAGVSLERKDPLAISIDPANWGSSRSISGSTPAGINTLFEADRLSPTLVFARIKENRIEVLFSEFINLKPDTYFFINGAKAVVNQYSPGRANRIFLTGAVSTSDSEMIVRGENLYDFQDNETRISELPVARQPEPGDLVINEIMYQEITGDPDSGLSQSEYIELANTRNFTLSLEGIYLHEAADEYGSYRRIDFADTGKKSLQPGEFAIIYPEPADVPYHLSRTGVFFNASVHENRLGLRADRVTLSLVNSGKEIYLADSTGTELDYVFYNPSWHNPNLTDTRGISLERISIYEGSNNAANWTSCPASRGGTPASANKAAPNPDPDYSDMPQIQLEPNPFSPDGDGFEDILSIRYQLDDPDYLVRARIFDRYGRHVRTLAVGDRSGMSGELLWDGLSDTGHRNRIGIYIILIEAFNGSTGSGQQLRKTVVLARQL